MWHELITPLTLRLGNLVLVDGGWVGMFITCLFCWIRGGRSDRIAAAVFAACWIGDATVGWAWLRTTGDLRPPMISDVVWDVTPAFVFLWLSFTEENLWFGAAAVFQGLQLALDATDHAVREPMGTPLPVALISTMGVMNFAMMAAMIGAALRRHRSQATAQAA